MSCITNFNESKRLFALILLCLVVLNLSGQDHSFLRGIQCSEIEVDGEGKACVLTSKGIYKIGVKPILIPKSECGQDMYVENGQCHCYSGELCSASQELISLGAYDADRESRIVGIFDNKIFLIGNGLWSIKDGKIVKEKLRGTYQPHEITQVVDFGRGYVVISNALIPLEENEKVIVCPGKILSATTFNSKVYLAIENLGLYVIDDGHAKKYVSHQIAMGDSVLSVVTSNGFLFVVSKTGLIAINQATKEELNISSLVRIKPIEIMDMVVDLWGNLWVAHENGVYCVPFDDKKQSVTPHLKMNRISLFNGDELVDHDLYDDQIYGTFSTVNFEVESYAGPFSTDHVLQYSVDGGDWHGMKDGMLTLYGKKTPSRSIAFRASHDGRYFSDPLNYSIRKSENANRNYILGLGLLLLGLLGFGFYAMRRSEKYKREITAERDKLILENNLLKYQQKALQLQMNPHFIFNALNSIQGLIAVDKNSEARKYLSKFSSMMRMALNHSRSDFIPLTEEVRFLEDYLSLEQLSMPDKFDFNLDGLDMLEDDLEIPPMLIQPFVENAIVHGFKNLQKKGKIVVSFREAGGGLICEVNDNGVGRNSTLSNPKTDHKSAAVDIVNSRLRNYWMDSKEDFVTFEDKQDQNNNPLGTKVVLHIPIK